MIIPTWQQVLDGRQTELRVVVKPGEVELVKPLANDRVFFKHNQMFIAHPANETREITAVEMNGRRKWTVGATYTVQPGRGKRAVGRIRILEIRQERLQAISEDSVVAEGCALQQWAADIYRQYPRSAGYAQLWDSLHPRKNEQWTANPLVWCLRFELVK